MSDSTASASASKPSRLCAAVPWVIGLVLILGVAPLVRMQVSLSDELDLYSLLLPVWTLAQLALIAGLLSWLRVRSTGWSVAVRAIVALVIALIIGVLQPVILTSISTIVGSSAAPLSGDRLQAILLWSTPLLLYVIPAAFVAYSWVRSATLRVAHVLGLASVVVGVLNIVAIFWFTHLWALYVR